jgi:hypothetical protein
LANTVTQDQQSSYNQGYKVGHDDFVKEGISHHLKAEDNAPDMFWHDVYFRGWGDACMAAGNSDDQCGSWEDYYTA